MHISLQQDLGTDPHPAYKDGLTGRVGNESLWPKASLSKALGLAFVIHEPAPLEQKTARRAWDSIAQACLQTELDINTLGLTPDGQSFLAAEILQRPHIGQHGMYQPELRIILIYMYI